MAYGAGGSQANAYWFDGVDISNPVDGTYWIYPNYNWIEEVQVVGIGAPAEYGGFSGVITNTVSRSGSNEFHGLVETFFQNDSLQGENIDEPGLEELGSDTTDLFTDSTIQLGGRIILDKLWFFSSAEYLGGRIILDKLSFFSSAEYYYDRTIACEPGSELCGCPRHSDSAPGSMRRRTATQAAVRRDHHLHEVRMTTSVVRTRRGSAPAVLTSLGTSRNLPLAAESVPSIRCAMPSSMNGRSVATSSAT